MYDVLTVDSQAGLRAASGAAWNVSPFTKREVTTFNFFQVWLPQSYFLVRNRLTHPRWLLYHLSRGRWFEKLRL